MPLQLYNTLSKREEEFHSLDEEVGTLRQAQDGDARKPRVTIYTCGPTVYGRPHIGNYASFLMADLLRRWLEVSGYEVLHVKNITDVGHIVADADSGEDKIERQARAEKARLRQGFHLRSPSYGGQVGGQAGRAERLEAEDVLKIARKYEAEFLEDERALNILEPLARPRATETIQEMLSITRTLLKKSHAYETDDGIYFAVSGFPGYGLLSGNTLANLGKLLASVRIEVKESKRHPADFALWKKCVSENARHILRWNFKTGERVTGVGEDSHVGFPGWHIECSAMSTKYLGEQIDIHTGGEDNIFPHHECEIAQSEGAFGKPFVHYWVHRRRVNFALRPGSGQEEKKMSKSLGNILTLPEIVARGFHPLDLRYYLLSSHYRSHMVFSWKGLEDARKARLRVTDWIEEMQKRGQVGQVSKVRKVGKKKQEEGVEEFQRRFTEAMDADLNTPEALAAVFDCMAFTRSEARSTKHEIRNFIEMVKKTFGCFEPEAFAIPAEIKTLVAEREEARRVGDYARSDVLRKEALKRGFILEDMKDGTKVVPKARR